MHATLWEDGNIFDLNQFLTADDKRDNLWLESVIGIDGFGNIYGRYHSKGLKNGGTYKLSLVSDAPLPEPSTWARRKTM